MTNWPEFAAHMLDESWLEANPPWPVGRVPRDKEEAERRYWPWPLSVYDEERLREELAIEVARGEATR